MYEVRVHPWPLLLWGFLVGVPLVSAAEPGDVEFFEKKIRPVFVEHCHSCHAAGAKSIKGGLRVDSRDRLLKGGDTGPAVVPGKPGDSLLLRALRHTDDNLHMPPKGKLSDAVIADVERWIARGAVFPASSTSPASLTLAEARRHWAFRPIEARPVPAVKDASWSRSPIDRFLLARLEERGLSPSPPADPRTFLRRLTLDLTGLPPTFAEVEAFANDRSPDAVVKVVERLLASPAYGERWGRHWLDVARYADTKDGVLMYGDDRIRPYAYTYRDYVVRAFNEDVPFDRFVHEQLAADQLGGDPARLAAMGFLTLGREFDNNIHDVLDDRIDTVTRGFLGLTVSCARCHDHKYDPIPSADYYALYGVFASSEQPLVPPLLDPAGPSVAEFDKQFAPKRQAVEQMLISQFALQSETAKKRVGDYLVHVVTTKPDPLETAIYFLSLAPTDLRPPIVARWRNYLARRVRADDPVFGPWHNLFALPDADFSSAARKVLQDHRGINPLVVVALTSAPLNNKTDVARVYGKLLTSVYEESKSKPPTDADRRQLLEIVAGKDSPSYFPRSHTRHYMSRMEKDAFGGKVQELDRLAVKSPLTPPRAVVLNDAEEKYDPHVFIRGNPTRLGESVPRRFLWIVAGDQRQPFPNGSGRLDLARAITAADNPLTSRVFVNRVWMHHFGEPLVDTPNDFGTRSTPPTHPELLDYLALRFQRDSWSLKNLHRLIVLSSAYQQASFDRPECRRVDPDNRLVWRMNRRRLDLESMRDSLLALSGRLQHRRGGRPVDIAHDPINRVRTVYGLVDRQSLPGLFRSFDFASPDQSAERRPLTTVPQQALFGMNAPFVLEQTRSLAARQVVASEKEPARRIAALYRLALLRVPQPQEVALALDFIAAAERSQQGPLKSQLDAWQQLAQVLLLTNEMMFVD